MRTAWGLVLARNVNVNGNCLCVVNCAYTCMCVLLRPFLVHALVHQSVIVVVVAAMLPIARVIDLAFVCVHSTTFLLHYHCGSSSRGSLVFSNFIFERKLALSFVWQEQLGSAMRTMNGSAVSIAFNYEYWSFFNCGLSRHINLCGTGGRSKGTKPKVCPVFSQPFFAYFFKLNFFT